MRGSVVVLLAHTLLAACDGGDDALWRLRPGVTEVISEKAGTVEATVITDVDRDGDRIALLRPSNSSESFLIYPNISLSEDRGRTWRHVWVPKEVRIDLGGDSFQLGVHLQDGRVFLVLSADAGNSFSVWRVYEVDMDTGATTEVTIPLTRTGFFVEHHSSGHLRWTIPSGLHSTPPHLVMDLDATTGEVTYEEMPCSGAACGMPMFHSRDGGDTWAGYTQPQPGVSICVSQMNVPSVTTTESCVARPVWPTTNYGYVPAMMFRGETPYMVWNSTTEPATAQAYATALLPGTPPTVSETLMLGPGLVNSYGTSVGTFPRRRFADFTFLENRGSVGSLVGLGAAGAERVEFPTTPCTVEDGCGYEDPPTFGYGQVQWLLPVENGEYLVFYTTVIDAKGGQAIYVAREKPTFGAITGAVPPPMTEVDLPDGAQPMTELEQACALYAQCKFFPTVLYKQCLDHWITETATRPGLAAARTRFLAAATSCAALDAIESSGCPLECTESGGSCGANGTGPCSTEIANVPGNCGTCDGNGNYILCSYNATRSFAVACGGGTVCSANVGCVLSGTNACDAYQPSPSCVNGAVRTCAPSQLLTLASCSLEGATCDAGTATCAPTSTEGACSPATYDTQCASATHLLHCSYGQIRYVACSDLGYSECVAQVGGAICQ